MNITFLLPNVLIAAFIASLLLSACGKSDSNDPAQAATGPSRPVQTAKTDKKLQTYRRVKKTYNGQTVYLLEMDDFPLRDVPLATIRENAEAGDPAAEYELGRRIGIGEGVEQDFHESFQWIKKAAKHNNPDAQFELGLTFSLGAGVRQNPEQALFWYEKAAEQGHVLAQDNRGVRGPRGQGSGLHIDIIRNQGVSILTGGRYGPSITDSISGSGLSHFRERQ